MIKNNNDKRYKDNLKDFIKKIMFYVCVWKKIKYQNCY